MIKYYPLIARLTGYQINFSVQRAKPTKIGGAKLIGSKRLDERSSLNKVINNNFVHQSQDSQLPRKVFFVREKQRSA